MKNIEGNNYYLYFVLFVYVLLLGTGIWNHEFWMDESHHWLLARDSANLIDLFNNYRYDGHPMLWVFFLWLIGLVTSDIIFVQIFHAIIATTIAYVVLFKSPFKKRYSILFIFGYYPLFEYGVLSRNYSLAILFFLLFAVFYKKNGKLLLPFIFLGLASNSHLFGFLFSVILSLKILYDEKLMLKKHLVSIGVIFGMLLFSFITIKAPSDHYFYFDTSRLLDFKNFAKLATMWWRAIVPIPDFLGSGLWNTNFFLANFRKTTIILALLSWSIPLLVLKRKSGYYLVFYFYVLAIVSFCLVTGLHLSQRISGFLLYGLLVLVWIEKNTTDSRNNILVMSNISKPFMLYTFLIIQIISSSFLLITDINKPFSNTKNIYNFLLTNVDNKTPIYGGLYCNYIGVNNYGNLNMHIASQKEKIKYCDWRILNLNKKSSYLDKGIEWMIINEFNEMILLSNKEISDFDQSNYKIKLIGRLQNAMINNENAFIYRIRKSETSLKHN